MTFQRTTAIDRLLTLTQDIRVIPGGTWAGKTYGILPIEIDYAIKHPGTRFTCVAETVPAVKEGPLKDFKEIMQDTGRWNRDRFNATDRIYTFYNGSTMQFTAYDSPGKARQAGKRNRLFANEANLIDQEILDALIIRTDGVKWFDYNPTHEFWIDQEWADAPNVDWLTLTYLDNEALPESILNMIEQRKEKGKTSDYWANWYKVYGLGQRGRLQGTIFDNWKTIPNIPEDARLVGAGLDFGYSNDPTAIIEVYKYNDKRILHERLYKKGLVNEEIANYVPNCTVWADSAEPKSIEEIRRLGHDIRGVRKGRDSIVYGIQVMQGQDYLVTEGSLNLIRELRNYCYDKKAKDRNKPIDDFNHAIDAVRYHEMESVGLYHEATFFSFT